MEFYVFEENPGNFQFHFHPSIVQQKSTFITHIHILYNKRPISIFKCQLPVYIILVCHKVLFNTIPIIVNKKIFYRKLNPNDICTIDISMWKQMSFSIKRIPINVI